MAATSFGDPLADELRDRLVRDGRVAQGGRGGAGRDKLEIQRLQGLRQLDDAGAVRYMQ
jgi:hypothetical protein